MHACVQLAVVAFASATVFVRARNHTASVEDGRTFLSYLFYSIYFMNASAWSELSITVRPQSSLQPHRSLALDPTFSCLKSSRVAQGWSCWGRAFSCRGTALEACRWRVAN